MAHGFGPPPPATGHRTFQGVSSTFKVWPNLSSYLPYACPASLVLSLESMAQFSVFVYRMHADRAKGKLEPTLKRSRGQQQHRRGDSASSDPERMGLHNKVTCTLSLCLASLFFSMPPHFLFVCLPSSCARQGVCILSLCHNFSPCLHALDAPLRCSCLMSVSVLARTKIHLYPSLDLRPTACTQAPSTQPKVKPSPAARQKTEAQVEAAEVGKGAGVGESVGGMLSRLRPRPHRLPTHS